LAERPEKSAEEYWKYRELEIWLEGTTKEYTTARTVTRGVKSQNGLSTTRR